MGRYHFLHTPLLLWLCFQLLLTLLGRIVPCGMIREFPSRPDCVKRHDIRAAHSNFVSCWNEPSPPFICNLRAIYGSYLSYNFPRMSEQNHMSSWQFCSMRLAVVRVHLFFIGCHFFVMLSNNICILPPLKH